MRKVLIRGASLLRCDCSPDRCSTRSCSTGGMTSAAMPRSSRTVEAVMEMTETCGTSGSAINE